jgi:hypothetical protein
MIEVDLSIWINKTPYQSEKPTNAAQDDDKHNAAQDDDKHNAAQDDDNLKKQNKKTKKQIYVDNHLFK